MRDSEPRNWDWQPGVESLHFRRMSDSITTLGIIAGSRSLPLLLARQARNGRWLAVHTRPHDQTHPRHADQPIAWTIETDDLNATVDGMRSRGMRFMTAPVTEEFGAYAELQDPDGRIVVLREPPVGHYFDIEPPALSVVVGSLAGTELVAAPGTLFKYSNAGVAWVGRVLEAKAEVPFADLMQREVIEPLGLPRARFAGNGRDDVVQGIMWTYDGRAIPTPRVDLGLGPAANLCASMPELARFAQSWFLGAHRQPHALLREESQRAMFTAQFNLPWMGLAFFLGDLDGKRMVSHGGAYYGVASLVASYAPSSPAPTTSSSLAKRSSTTRSRAALRPASC